MLKNENAELKKLFNIETLKEKNDNSIEQWFDIEGWEGKYQVSNLGNVKSLEREFINCKGGLYKVKEKILKHQYDYKRNMYYVVLNNRKYKEKYYIKNIPFKELKQEHNQPKFKYPQIQYVILQYDLNKKLVHKWNSFKEIEEQTTMSIQSISKSCNKNKKYNNSKIYKNL